MGTIALPGVMSGPPRAFDNKDWDTGEKLPGQTYQHVVMIHGMAFKSNADVDLTESLNGEREALLASDPVKVTALFDIYPQSKSGRPALKLVGIEPRK